MYITRTVMYYDTEYIAVNLDSPNHLCFAKYLYWILTAEARLCYLLVFQITFKWLDVFFIQPEK